uniref:Uncharacterized protein n=1 Tax=Anguilla anguilla TaxID=7936 RepID=A0A0E9US37_ANGAN
MLNGQNSATRGNGWEARCPICPWQQKML